MKLQSLRSSRLGAAAAAAALVGTAALLPATTAYASNPTTIGEFECNSWGAGQFFCNIQVSGGTPPYTVNWAGTNVTGFSSTGQSYALGYCVQGQYAQVTVFVVDGSGSAQASQGFACQ